MVLASFVEMLEDHFAVPDPSSWIEMRLWDDVPITRAEMYAGGRYDLLLEMAAGHIDVQAALDIFMPDWRDAYPPSDFEVFMASDGDLAIRQKQQ